MSFTRIFQHSLAILAMFLATEAFSLPIQYEFDLTGVSGTLNSSAFSNQSMTVTFAADTANVHTFVTAAPVYHGWVVNGLTAGFSLSGGLGSGTFAPSAVFDNQTIRGIGFTSGQNQILTLISPISGLNTYDLKSNFGPLVTPFVVSLQSWVNVQTSLGALTVSSARTGTFSATETAQVPEPATAALMILALALGVASRRWHARRIAAK